MPAKKQTTRPSGMQAERMEPACESSEVEKDQCIVRYLATLGEGISSEVAQLAATLATRESRSEPSELLARAIDLRETAELAIHDRKTSLLRKCCESTLQKLDTALKDRGFSSEHPDRVAVRFERTSRGVSSRRDALTERQQEWEKIIATVERESRKPRPVLPCSRNDALRWAVSAPEALPWERIESAFIDFLCLPPSDWKGKTRVHRSSRLAAKATYEQYWPREKECDLQTLSELASKFREFWQKSPSELRWKSRGAGAKKTNQIKEANRLLTQVTAFVDEHPPGTRTREAALTFRHPGMNPKNARESLWVLIDALTRKANGTLPDYFQGRPEERAIAYAADSLRKAHWLEPADARNGDPSPPSNRQKSGRFQKESPKGISYDLPTVENCLNLLES